MEYKDLSQDLKNAIIYVAENIDVDDACVDLSEAGYLRCRLADINPWLDGRIEELMTEYCKDNAVEEDWEFVFSDTEEILGLAIEWNSLYGHRRYKFRAYHANGYIDERSLGKHEADDILTLISEAEKNPEILSYAVERDGEVIIDTSNKVNHDVLD